MPDASSEPLCAHSAPGGATLIARSLRVARTAGARAEERRTTARPRDKLCVKIETRPGKRAPALLGISGHHRLLGRVP